MEAKQGNAGFDFIGKYTEIEPNRFIAYQVDDGREVRVSFEPAGESTRVKEIFASEGTHSAEMQRSGWQSILDRFKGYVESRARVEDRG
jgi:uncharacterized protein YndB with AHSA1/START domain